jgi:hypothetical protein
MRRFLVTVVGIVDVVAVPAVVVVVVAVMAGVEARINKALHQQRRKNVVAPTVRHQQLTMAQSRQYGRAARPAVATAVVAVDVTRATTIALVTTAAGMIVVRRVSVTTGRENGMWRVVCIKNIFDSDKRDDERDDDKRSRGRKGGDRVKMEADDTH